MQVKIVAVSFKDMYKQGQYATKTYHYLCDSKVKVGDFAIVDSPADGVVVTLVREVGLAEEFPDGKATKWVVSIVDLGAYIVRKEKEARKVKVEAMLDTRLKTMDKQLRLQMLADIDPVAAKLLEELKNY